MKRRMILWAALPALALAACSGSTKSVDPARIRLEPPQAALTAPCARPVRIPLTATTQAAQEALWRRDRINLANCADRHSGLVAWSAGVAGAVGRDWAP